MDWQEACMQSKDGLAKRTTATGRKVIRCWDGTADIQTGPYPTDWREARISEAEGHMDWEPINPKEQPTSNPNLEE